MKTAFPPVIDKQTKVLILGTMPGERSLALNQYYGHPGNHFWKIMFHLFGQEFSKDYGRRIELLKINHVGLWDVLSHCEGTGSADSDIKNEIPNDFELFHQEFPQIRHVIFASKQAEKFYGKYAEKQKDIQYHTLPSPSGANASMSFQQKAEKWTLILELLVT